MYNQLYAAWKREIQEASLGALPPDFYVKMAEYLRQINGEDKILDKKSLKVNLLGHEAQNVKRMLDELLRARYKKLVKTISQNQKLPSDLLTLEEAKMSETFVAFSGEYQKFAKDMLQGEKTEIHVKIVETTEESKVESKVELPVVHKRVTVRFSKSIPAIMGFDMKSYGPFVPEDVASLPAENAKILVKQGLAVPVEVS